MKYFIVLKRRHTLIIFPLLILICITHSSCVLVYFTYIRNTTSSIASIDVFLPDNIQRLNVSDSVMVANNFTDFKSGFEKHFTGYAPLKRVDSIHYRIEIQPNTIISLSPTQWFHEEDLYNMKITVTSNNKTDTLLNRQSDYTIRNFKRKNVGFPVTRILYYDVEK